MQLSCLMLMFRRIVVCHMSVCISWWSFFSAGTLLWLAGHDVVMAADVFYLRCRCICVCWSCEDVSALPLCLLGMPGFVHAFPPHVECARFAHWM